MEKAIHRALIDYIDTNRDELFRLVQELVRIPSVVPNEGPAQKRIEQLYRDFGLDVHLLTADHAQISRHPAFIESGAPYAGRPNVIGILPGAPDAPSLTINGHIDVVSPEPVSAWQHDPWGGEISGGKLYGRGACDMKGGLAANYFAVKAVKALGLKPKGTVMLQSVVEEEAGGGPGTLACLLAGYRTDGFVATEPHFLKTTVAHAGILYFRVKVQGKTIHAGLAHLGVNAIGKIIPIYEALAELDRQRGESVYFDLFAKGSGRSTHLNIGKLVAGDWASTVAGFASLDCRISFIPGETEADIKELIASTVARVAAADPWLVEHPPVIEWFGWHADPWYQDPEAPYVQSFRQSAATVLGELPEIIGRASGLDSRFTQFFPGMSGICFGPTGERLHGIDECVDLESLVQTAQVLAVHIVDWCGIAGGD